jgi:hypothetical protein
MACASLDFRARPAGNLVIGTPGSQVIGSGVRIAGQHGRRDGKK